MKRKITMMMALLASTLMLASCSDAESFIKSYLDSSNESSQTDASTPSGDNQESNWTQTDLALMQSLFTDYVLPYPQGLTESHESSIESDDDGDYLYIYDGACEEEIAGSYTQILEDDGYTYNSTTDGYYIYYSESEGIVVQFGYFTEDEVEADEEYGFYCLAWVGEISEGDDDYQTYASFPYAAIGTFFNTTVDSTMIPSFEIASGESYYGAGLDLYGEFIVYGYYDSSKTSAQMITAYTNSVKALGYTTSYDSDYDYYEATSSTLDFSLYYYVEDDEDGSSYFCLEIVYDEEEMVPYDSFPYSAIATYFGRTSVTSSQIPSFSIMSDTSYYGIGSESAGIKYFAVGGYMDSSTTATAMIESYTNSLKALGYTTGYYSDEDLYYGESTKLGFSIYYYTEEQTSSTGTDNVFYVMIYDDGEEETDDPSTPGGDEGNKDTVTGTISIGYDDFPKEYPTSASTATIDKASFKYNYIMQTDSKIQFKKSAGYLYNTTPLSISKATVTYDSERYGSDYFGALSIYVSNSPLTSATGGSKITPTNVSNVYTYDFGGTYSYVYMVDETSYAVRCTSIVLS